MAKTQDRRVQRTQQLLRTSLFSLIQEKGFERLSVQDILDRANIGRATFYAHFDNKEDLLLSGFDALRKQLRDLQRAAHSGGAPHDDQTFAYSRDLIGHVHEFRDLFKAMVGKKSGAVVQSALRKLVIDLVRDDLKGMSQKAEGRNAAKDAVAEFIAGGLMGLLFWWLEARERIGVEEMNALFRRFAVPAARASL